MARRKRPAPESRNVELKTNSEARWELILADLDLVQLEPEDWIAKESVQVLYDDAIAHLSGEALLEHYRKHHPEDIVDEQTARLQSWRRHLPEGSAFLDADGRYRDPVAT